MVVVLAACGDDDSGGGGGGTFDAAVDTGNRDAELPSCAASGFCSEGPMCGPGCCSYGQHCVNGECRCGNDPACGTGDYCTSGGPILPSHGCGLFCCGPASGVGCPI